MTSLKMNETMRFDLMKDCHPVNDREGRMIRVGGFVGGVGREEISEWD